VEELIHKYARKLVDHGLCRPEDVLLGGQDADMHWNRGHDMVPLLQEVAAGLNIQSILFAKPAAPYGYIMDCLKARYAEKIQPDDTETRTFLHDIPVAPLAAGAITAALRRRKSVLVPGGVITFGTVSPEQAFVTFNSVCFACYVKFFTDYAQRGEGAYGRTMDIVTAYRDFLASRSPDLAALAGPYDSRQRVLEAMFRAGRYTIDSRLVDSYFGNVSYRMGNDVFISQTGSSLDELEGCVDVVPLDGSSCAGITASSELPAHRDVYLHSEHKAILHGHPKFCVIMSMLCDKQDCPQRGRCHVACPEKRCLGDVPIISGEVGAGVHGLCHTLPKALANSPGAIVWGHGLFTVSDRDLAEAFSRLLAIEHNAVGQYMQLMERTRHAAPHH